MGEGEKVEEKVEREKVEEKKGKQAQNRGEKD